MAKYDFKTKKNVNKSMIHYDMYSLLILRSIKLEKLTKFFNCSTASRMIS